MLISQLNRLRKLQLKISRLRKKQETPMNKMKKMLLLNPQLKITQNKKLKIHFKLNQKKKKKSKKAKKIQLPIQKMKKNKTLKKQMVNKIKK